MSKRIVLDVRVPVPRLRICEFDSTDASRIGAHEPAHRRCVVPGPEVVQPRFCVAFFAGEVVLGSVCCSPESGEIIPERQTGEGGGLQVGVTSTRLLRSHSIRAKYVFGLMAV